MTPAEHLAVAEQLITDPDDPGERDWNEYDRTIALTALAHAVIALAIELGVPHGGPTGGATDGGT